MSEEFQSFQEQQSISEEVKPMPAFDKFVGIFTSPGEVFENVVKAKRNNLDWILPLVAMIVLLVIATFIRFGNETLRESFYETQEMRIDKLVEEGKMTEEQAEIAKERMTQFAGTQKIFAAVGALISTPILFLIVSLVFYLLGRLFLKGDVDFMTIFTVYALSTWILSVGIIVSTALALLTGNFFASASPTLFMKYTPDNKFFILASKFEIFSLWQLAVFAVGISKAFGKNYSSGFALVFGTWALWVVVSIFVPFLRF